MIRRTEVKAVALNRERRERGVRLLWVFGSALTLALALLIGGRALAQKADEAPEITVDMAPLDMPVDDVIEEVREEADSAVPTEETGFRLYRRGLYKEAFKEWSKAVESGDVGAAYRLGEEYFDAKVVKRDIEKALKYYKIGANGGDPRAQMDLGTLYDNGWGVERDIAEAAKWYLAAAQQGMVEAQYNVATLYEKGDGLELDLERAYMYYLLAVEGGFAQFATTALENVSRMMSPTQIKEATGMARAFQIKNWEEIQAKDG
ncbi:tetratricopeptide repeat protein [Tepidicaulis sp.]|uniref:tetratricopeptide repeat protein n=1 Tax=Tepidicaulis sp. TaxID=1920809 RepID=UPI003B5A174F